MPDPSGRSWCAQFPGSNSTADLTPTFQVSVDNFIARMRAAGATVTVSATYRPPERAYLMHWCGLVGGYKDKRGVFHPPQTAPGDVPAMPGVDIDWTHGGDRAAAVAGAGAMVAGYGIVYPAVLVSRHTQRRAVDMTISWKGNLAIADAAGVQHMIASAPRSGSNAELIAVGKTFSVIKLLSDPPHWSDDGH